MVTAGYLGRKSRSLSSENRGKDAYLTTTRAPSPSFQHLEVNLDLFMTTLHRATLIHRTGFKEQGIVVVVALVEVETLVCLHEPLFRQRHDFPRRRRRRHNIAIDLLHEEIAEWEAEGREWGRGVAREMDSATVLCLGRRPWRAGQVLPRQGVVARLLTTMESRVARVIDGGWCRACSGTFREGEPLIELFL